MNQGSLGDDRDLIKAQLRRAAEDLATTLGELEEERSSRERVEAELRVAHRLEAVGQLAAGVAHEINTPIQYAGDSVRFLQTAFEDVMPVLELIPSLVASLRDAGDPVADTLERAWSEADGDFVVEQVPAALSRSIDGIERVAAIVRAMKAFAHPGGAEQAPADLNEALGTTLAVARNEYKYVADVETELGEIPLVMCRLAELNQVFLNLLVNAAHAIADVVEGTDNRGRITISTTIESGFVHIRFADTGVGIPVELRDRIFDPFFTTKPVGKGTGQGLGIAQSIVSKHGGVLSFESEIGVGTTFEVKLPVTGGRA